MQDFVDLCAQLGVDLGDVCVDEGLVYPLSRRRDQVGEQLLHAAPRDPLGFLVLYARRYGNLVQ